MQALVLRSWCILFILGETARLGQSAFEASASALREPSLRQSSQSRPGVVIPRGARVAVINACDFHHEVYPAFHFAFQSAGYSVTTYATGWERRNLLPGLRDWNFRVADVARLRARDICGADLAIFTSIEYSADHKFCLDLIEIGCIKNFLFVVHNVKHLNRASLIQLLQLAPNVEIYTLAPHTANTARSVIASGGLVGAVRVSYLVPIFPFDCGDSGATRDDYAAKDQVDFVVQGSVDVARRSYRELISDLAKQGAALPPGLHLKILGQAANTSVALAFLNNAMSNELTIPAELRNQVERIENKPYCEYFGHIQSSVALLTAFASKSYFKYKASSTIAASLITKTPLLTTSNTPRIYDYISPGSVWAKRPRQSDAEAVLEVAALPEMRALVAEKRRSLEIDAARAYERNGRAIQASMLAFGKTDDANFESKAS